MTMQPVLIGLDWGTSNLRAYLIDETGAVVDRREALQGILNVQNRDFAGVLQALIGEWFEKHATLPIVACGMVGSRQGWHEVPYVGCPADADDVARQTISVTIRAGRQVHIVPGLVHLDAGGVPDLMRGEETQIFGALQAQDARQQFILPGTHSKWAMVERGRIVRFVTFMTGELYDLLRNHSILGRMMEGEDHDAAAFRRGVECKTEQGGLLKNLFGARSLPLLDRLPRSGVSSYLSGLLIGSEIDGALTWLRATGQVNGAAIVLGSEALSQLYVEALRIKEISVVVGVRDSVGQGLLRIARLKGLL